MFTPSFVASSSQSTVVNIVRTTNAEGRRRDYRTDNILENYERSQKLILALKNGAFDFLLSLSADVKSQT